MANSKLFTEIHYIKKAVEQLQSDHEESRKDRAETNRQLAIYNEQLASHMRRTELLENRLDSIWSRGLVVLSLLSGALLLVKQFLSL
jgi:archaellum component FlaC